MKAPLTAVQEAIKAIDGCKHTGLNKPECCCTACIEELLRGHRKADDDS